MADFLAQSFTDLKARAGADHVLLASLEQAFRDLRGELRVLNSAVELYKAEAVKKERFLLEQFKDTMATHAKIVHDRLEKLERPGKTDNNMR